MRNEEKIDFTRFLHAVSKCCLKQPETVLILLNKLFMPPTQKSSMKTHKIESSVFAYNILQIQVLDMLSIEFRTWYIERHQPAAGA